MFSFQIVDSMEYGEARSAIQEETIDLLLVFPADFETLILQYDVNTGTAAPQVQIFYNSNNEVSSLAFNTVLAALSCYEDTLANKFDVNKDSTISYNLADEEGTLTNLYSSIVPSMLILFISLGSIQAASESIAGEKERGTIATIFMTPIGKSVFATGKILGLSSIALLSGFSGFLGSVISLPSIANVNRSVLSANMYGIKEVLMMLLVIVSTVFLIVSIVSLLSCISKSVKEAQAYCNPFMILGSLAGLSVAFPQAQEGHIWNFFIPIYNSSKCFRDILQLKYLGVSVCTTAITNICFAIILVYVISKLLSNEKIAFPD